MSADTCPNSSVIQAEQWSRTWRRRALRDAFRDINQLIINTGKYPKVEAAIKIVQNLVAPKIDFANGNVIQLPSTKDEPASTNAAEVSKYKAEVARHEHVEAKFPELAFLLRQLNLAIEQDLANQIIEDLLKGIIFLGADINVFISNDKNEQQLVQHHKLERNERCTPIIPEEIYESLRKELYKTYVYPEAGLIRVVWQIAMTTINSSHHQFTDWIEVIAKPVPAELLEIYLHKALDNGAILKSNAHIELFEMLCESGCIKYISRLPDDLLKKGYCFAQLRQSPSQPEITAIQKSIVTNAPVYVC